MKTLRILLLAAITALSGAALAQNDPNEIPIHQATHGDWQLSCFRNTLLGSVRCGLEQVQPLPGIDDEHAALLIQGDSELRILVLISSAGFAADGPVGIRVDDNRPVATRAGTDNYIPIDPQSSAPLIQQMKAGAQFIMSYTTADGAKTSVRFSLTGVTAGMNDFVKQVGG